MIVKSSVQTVSVSPEESHTFRRQSKRLRWAHPFLKGSTEFSTWSGGFADGLTDSCFAPGGRAARDSPIAVG